MCSFYPSSLGSPMFPSFLESAYNIFNILGAAHGDDELVRHIQRPSGNNTSPSQTHTYTPLQPCALLLTSVDDGNEFGLD